MTGQHICLECGQPFSVLRTLKNRNAVIRYCYDCKEVFEDVRQAERAAGGILAMCSPRQHLATN